MQNPNNFIPYIICCSITFVVTAALGFILNIQTQKKSNLLQLETQSQLMKATGETELAKKDIELAKKEITQLKEGNSIMQTSWYGTADNLKNLEAKLRDREFELIEILSLPNPGDSPLEVLANDTQNLSWNMIIEEIKKLKSQAKDQQEYQLRNE